MKTYVHIRRWAGPVLFFSICYLMTDAGLWMLARQMHIRSFPPEVRAMLDRIHLSILCFSSGACGILRATQFHPVSRKGYLDWLRATPWHPGMKLPLGPATLVWWDMLVLFAAAALAHWHLHQSILLPLLSFCCAYVVFSLVPLSSTFRWSAYVLGVGLAFVARWIQSPEISGSIAGGLLLLTQYALWRSLRGFPWDREPAADPLTRQGWLGMIPPDTKPLVPAHRALAGCAAFGVWLWAILCLAMVRPGPAEVSLSFCLAAVIGLVFRSLAYCGKYHPPLTLLGRLRTGHLIIPGYDYVMLASAAVLPIAAVLPLAFAAIGAPAPFSISATAAACLAVLLMAPPSLRVWQLTGTHRAVGIATGQGAMRA